MHMESYHGSFTVNDSLLGNFYSHPRVNIAIVFFMLCDVEFPRYDHMLLPETNRNVA